MKCQVVCCVSSWQLSHICLL